MFLKVKLSLSGEAYHEQGKTPHPKSPTPYHLITTTIRKNIKTPLPPTLEKPKSVPLELVSQNIFLNSKNLPVSFPLPGPLIESLPIPRDPRCEVPNFFPWIWPCTLSAQRVFRWTTRLFTWLRLIQSKRRVPRCITCQIWIPIADQASFLLFFLNLSHFMHCCIIGKVQYALLCHQNLLHALCLLSFNPPATLGIWWVENHCHSTSQLLHNMGQVLPDLHPINFHIEKSACESLDYTDNDIFIP